MTDKPYNLVPLDEFGAPNVFFGNTVIQDFIPDNSTIVIVGGSAVILGEIGRDVNITTKQSRCPTRRAAIEITQNQEHFPVEPDIKLNLGCFDLIARPHDVVVLSAPKDFSEEDAEFRLKPDYPSCTISSAGDVVFLRNTPERMSASVAGNFTCYGSLGKLNTVHFPAAGNFYARHIGDLCTVTTSGNIRTVSAGHNVALSCGGRVQFGPRKRAVIGNGFAATVADQIELFCPVTIEDKTEVFGDRKMTMNGINARVVVRRAGFFCSLKSRPIPKKLPAFEKIFRCAR